MRKSKALQIIAAAIVAAPGVAMAIDDSTGIPSPLLTTREVNPERRLGLDVFGMGGRFQLAQPSFGLSNGPEADVHGTWIGPSGGSWTVPTNWTSNPQFPDGPAAVATINHENGGGFLVLNANVTLSTLNFSDPQITAIGSVAPTPPSFPVLTFAPLASINSSNFPADPFGSRFFGNQIGFVGGDLTERQVTIAGSNGLTLNGGRVALRGTNTYTGTTTINNGMLTMRTDDSNLGSPANAVALNNGELWVQTTSGINTARAFTATGTSTITLGATGGTHNFNGAISGSGNLDLNGNFGGRGVFHAANPYSGNVNIGFGTHTLQGSGAFANAPSIAVNGTLILNNSGAPGNVNRISDTGTLVMRGTLQVQGAGALYDETIGNTVLDGGTAWFQVNPGPGVTLRLGNVTRSNQASAAFKGDNLGGAAGGSTQIHFNNGTASLKGGIIPWAYGTSGAFFTPPESNLNTLVSYGGTGVVPVPEASYVNMASANANTNVLVSGSADVPGVVNANALVLRNGNVTGNGTINLTTGVVLSGNAIDTNPGNIVTANINAGTNELVIHAPAAMTLNGVLSGSGGLTKGIGRTVTFNGQNTYTGETNLSGFIRFSGNVISGQPGPFGMDTSPIVLYGDRTTPINQTVIPAAAAGAGTAILALDEGAPAANFSRPLTVRGPSGALIRNFGSGPLTFSGAMVVDADSAMSFQGFDTIGVGQYVLNGPISGAGAVNYIGGANVVSPTFNVTINGNNSYSGGTDLEGDIRFSTDTAFGTGVIGINPFTYGGTIAPVMLTALGGPRTLANPIRLSGGTLVTQGASPITFSGPFDLNDGAGALIDVQGAATTISGPMSGFDLFKIGPGNLVISGNNVDMHANILAGDGVNAGGMIVLRSNTAAGSDVGFTAAFSQSSTIAVDGNVSMPNEVHIALGTGVSDLGSLRSLSGNNTFGRVVVQQHNAGTTTVLSSKGSVGVDSGALTLTGSIFTTGNSTAGTPADPLGVQKVGAGVLNVGSNAFVDTRANMATTTFQGSVVATGSLEVLGGTLRLSQSTGPSRSVAVVSGLTLAPGTRVDVTNNAMVVDYPAAGPSPLATIRSQVISGYAGGAWNGTGIMSSTADVSNFGVGYGEANNVLAFTGGDALFLGAVVDESAVLVRFTRYGDANLDGVVNLQDFNRLAANFGASGAIWTQGDFTYDGLVNLQDFNRLAANFGQMAGPDGPTPDDWSNLAAAIPEPSSLGLAAVGVVALMRRRRRA